MAPLRPVFQTITLSTYRHAEQACSSSREGPISYARSLLAILVFALSLALPQSSAHAERRVALVIGNATYANTPRLTNPANDATDIARALSGLGFQVIAESNLTKSGMDNAFRKFARAMDGADAALFYYAGHGMQFQGQNYLMPVDAKLQHEADLPYEMAKVDDVVADMSRVKGVRMVILDACRDNPLETNLKRTVARTRNIAQTRGLARMTRTQGLLLAYATQPGQVADDGGGRNSPFTTSLLRHIATPGLEVGALFRRVASDVNTSTGGKQTPELSVSLLGEFYFSKDGKPDTAQKPSDNTGTSNRSGDLTEKDAFEFAQRINNLAAWDAFLRRYSNGFFADMARAAREGLAAEGRKKREAEEARKRQEEDAAREREFARLEDERRRREEEEAERRRAANRQSFWDHNGSLMRLDRQGNARRFYYQRPSSRMARAVSIVDRLLFTGRQSGNRYSGTAYVFSSRCRRKFGYQVSGELSAGGKRLVMRGAAPVIGSNCRVSRYVWNGNSNLVFTFQYER